MLKREKPTAPFCRPVCEHSKAASRGADPITDQDPIPIQPFSIGARTRFPHSVQAVIADVLVPEKVSQYEPGVARSFPNAAIDHCVSISLQPRPFIDGF
jgi:hypothetical protein